MVNFIVKTSNQGKLSVFLINNINKLIRLQKESTSGEIVTAEECYFVNVQELNPLQQQTPLNVSSLNNLKQRTIVLVGQRNSRCVNRKMQISLQKGTLTLEGPIQ